MGDDVKMATTRYGTIERLAINGLVAAQVLLVVCFDYFPEGIRTVSAGVLALGYMSIAAAATLKAHHITLVKKLVLVCLAILLVWLLSALFVTANSFQAELAWAEWLRSITPYFCGVALVAAHRSLSKNLIRAIVILLPVLALAAAYANPSVFLGGSARWYPFSSGLHTSAYLIAICLILSWELLKRRYISAATFCVVAIVTLALILGYGVRTPIVLVAVFFVVDFIVANLNRKKFPVELFLSSAFLLGAIGILMVTLLLVAFGFDAANQFSSGRLSNYLERFDALSTRTPLGLLFGHGPGSALIQTSTWWWAVKDSHSDILNMLLEGGVFGLILLAAYLFILGRHSFPLLLAPMAGLLASSLVSNAMLVRPNVIFLFFCIIAFRLAAARDTRKPGANARRVTFDGAVGREKET